MIEIAQRARSTAITPADIEYNPHTSTRPTFTLPSSLRNRAIFGVCDICEKILKILFTLILIIKNARDSSDTIRKAKSKE